MQTLNKKQSCTHTYTILSFGRQLRYCVVFLYREPLPTVFSMLHPLDEIAPVVCKPTGMTHTHTHTHTLTHKHRHTHTDTDTHTHIQTKRRKTRISAIFDLILSVCVFFPGLFEGSRVQYASDSTMKIVFSCSQPSLIVSYDTLQGIHSVWALRKVTPDVSDDTDTYTNKQKHSLPVSNLKPFITIRSALQSCGVQQILVAHRWVWWHQAFWPPTSVISPVWIPPAAVGQ